MSIQLFDIIFIRNRSLLAEACSRPKDENEHSTMSINKDARKLQVEKHDVTLVLERTYKLQIHGACEHHEKLRQLLYVSQGRTPSFDW